MKTLKRKMTALYFLILSLILLPSTASAAPSVQEGCPQVNAFTSLKGLLSNENFNGTDPSKGLGSVRCFIFEITKIALTYAGIIAVIILLWGAFLYVTSYGDDAKIETAKKTVLWSIIGLVVLALAYTILNVFLNEI